MKLNKEQNEAVFHGDGPLLILAGAGSGKTRVITYRIFHLVMNMNLPASNICAVTFTNKSSNEMRERLTTMLKASGKSKSTLKGIFVGTFHALGLKIMRENPEILPVEKNFSIQGRDYQLAIVADVIREEGLDPDVVTDKSLLYMISQAKNNAPSLAEVPAWLDNEYGQPYGSCFKRYQEMLFNFNSVDFDDLILLPNELLRENHEIKEKYRKKFRHILIDEFQDTNPLQFSFLLKILAEPFNLFAVGDDDREVYLWRGADIRIILNFKETFPGSRVTYLQQNYRSKQTILDMANSLIKNNSHRHEKNLWSDRGDGDISHVYEAEDGIDEAEFICSEIEKIRNDIDLSEMAVLFRTNFQSRVFEEALRKQGIPYHLSGGYQFYDRKEIKDILSYLRFIANHNDEKSLLRIINLPRRNIGDKTLQKLRAYATLEKRNLWNVIEEVEECPVDISSASLSGILEFRDFITKFGSELRKPGNFSRAVKSMVESLNFEKEFARSQLEDKVIAAKLANVRELLNAVLEFELSKEGESPDKARLLYDYLQFISIMTSDNEKENTQSRVNLMTIHNAKGLEFEIVFIVGCHE